METDAMEKQWMRVVALLYGLLAFTSLKAQVVIGSLEQPHTSAMLEVKSNGNKGLLLPLVALKSHDDKETIPNPAKGLLVYNDTAEDADLSPGVYIWDGTNWRTMISAGIYLYPQSLTFEGMENATPPAAQTVLVINTGSSNTGKLTIDSSWVKEYFTVSPLVNSDIEHNSVTTFTVRPKSTTARGSYPGELSIGNNSVSFKNLPINYTVVENNHFICLPEIEDEIAKPLDFCVRTTDEKYMLVWEEAVTICKDYGPGWRLPELEELKTIFYHKEYFGDNFQATEGFCAYWSNTEWEYWDGRAWTYEFDGNHKAEYYNKDATLYVRCVKDIEVK